MAEFSGDTLTVRWENRGGGVVVTPMGDVDLTASPVLRQALRQVQAGKPARMVVDLAQVPYMDSSGVATLVEAMQIARKNSTRMALCGLTDRVRSIFEIARLDTVFTIKPDAQAALEG
ncbi:MAG TPA: STAS domain-containing protein [Phycisphaerales bacterium]|nr:STAS domain-containing protein [Phycisphaerales bacterium]